jgi:hypothetical protein
MKRPDFDTCTLQEACDYAVFKIVEQGGQCMRDVNSCAYGNDVGEHCAIGWMLDHDDKQLMKCGDDVNALVCTYDAGQLPGIIYENLEPLDLLQVFHDVDHSKCRANNLSELSKHINTTAPQYQQWVEMGK